MEFDQNGNPVDSGTAPESNEPAQDVQAPEQDQLEQEDSYTPETAIGALFDKADEKATGQQEAPEANPEVAPVEQPGQEQASQPQQTFKIKVQGQEKEVTQEDIIRLAQQGDDYSIKMQNLNAERMRLESVQPLAQAWEQDPAFRQHVMQYQQQAQVGQMPGQPPMQEQPLPDDPIEAIKEEAAREAVARFEAMQQEQARTQQAHAYTTRIQQAQHAVANDEMRSKVMDELNKIAPQGSALRHRFNNDPDLFFPEYVRTRNQLIANRQAPQQPRVPATPQPKVVTPHAPILESGGGEVPVDQPSKKERAKALREKASGGDFRAAGKLFDLAGQ